MKRTALGVLILLLVVTTLAARGTDGPPRGARVAGAKDKKLVRGARAEVSAKLAEEATARLRSLEEKQVRVSQAFLEKLESEFRADLAEYRRLVGSHPAWKTFAKRYAALGEASKVAAEGKEVRDRRRELLDEAARSLKSHASAPAPEPARLLASLARDRANRSRGKGQPVIGAEGKLAWRSDPDPILTRLLRKKAKPISARDPLRPSPAPAPAPTEPTRLVLQAPYTAPVVMEKDVDGVGQASAVAVGQNGGILVDGYVSLGPIPMSGRAAGRVLVGESFTVPPGYSRMRVVAWLALTRHEAEASVFLGIGGGNLKHTLLLTVEGPVDRLASIRTMDLEFVGTGASLPVQSPSEITGTEQIGIALDMEIPTSGGEYLAMAGASVSYGFWGVASSLDGRIHGSVESIEIEIEE